METNLVPRTGVPCFFIPMAPPLTVRGLLLTPLAILRSLAVLWRTRPAVVFATGGYVSTAPVVAAWLRRIPVVLFSPDIYPGKAVQRLAPLAGRVAVTAKEGGVSLAANKVVVTGYPLRPSFTEASRHRGREQFGISADATVLIVFGGSQGARRINEALARCLPDLLQRHHVIHVAGEKRLVEAQRAAADLAVESKDTYHLIPYLHGQDMADALAAADLAFCRSGASVLAELPATSTPAVLVPLPDPAVHQRENAEYLQEHGAAVVLDDSTLDRDLAPLLTRLLRDRPRLDRMAGAAAVLARPQATDALARLVEECAQ
jgi:UDP-N-acetylglucosamine--N-acetylmuramyl-(pentapeptide) pyrophosphoryl-undecaprenol N-acetylglucosamine transferase